VSHQELKVVTAGRLPHVFPEESYRGQAEFHAAHTDEELRVALRDADVLYSWQVPDTVPSQSPRLRWIHVPSAGVDHLKGHPVWASDILLSASTGIHTVPMSEHLFAMLLALTRQVASLVRAQERAEWTHDRPGATGRFVELRGKTMGIVGWGKIGDGAAHLARAFGMRVVGTRLSVVVPREVPRPRDAAYEDMPLLEPVDLPHDIVYPAAQLHDVLAQSDAVAVFLPLTDHTRHSISRAEFASMKRGALFFNMGRGSVVDEVALLEALESGHLGGAGLDVFDQEPLPASSPLWRMQNVVVSPHVGGMSVATRDRGARLFAVNMSRFLQGESLLNLVNRNEGY